MSTRKSRFSDADDNTKGDRSRSRSPQKPEPDTIKPTNIGLGAKNRLKAIQIQMKLGSKKPQEPTKPKVTVASAFNQDSDDEPEEMPPEARMRMRNIGRDTPTSSGPNSFGMTRTKIEDANKLFEKTVKEAMAAARADD